MRPVRTVVAVLSVLTTLVVAVPATSASETPAASTIEQREFADGSIRWVAAGESGFSAQSRSTRVLATSAERVFTAHADPNDPFFDEQWNFEQIAVTDAWSTSVGSGIVVAVLDSGLSPGPDLACRSIVDPFNAFDFSADVTDQTGHGTHVTGTVAQCTDNGLGVAGVAPGVAIMPVKVLDGSGAGTAASVANGIAWAVAKGADVITMSLGSDCEGQLWPTCRNDAVDIEIAKAVAADIPVVASTGNESQSVVTYPAAHPDVIAVGATSSAGDVAGYSNTGPNITLVAPGGDEVDRDASGNPDVVFQEREAPPGSNSAIIGMYGTSMAAPHVAGTLALMRAAHPEWSALRLRCVLIETAADRGAPGFDPSHGWGEIRPAAAVTHQGEAYTDVGDAWYRDAVDHVTDDGIALGYDDCTFRPTNPISRAEAVAMIVRATGLTPVKDPTGLFPDVPAGSVFAPYVEAAANEGWIAGYPDGSFGPEDDITRAEIAVIAARVWVPGFGASSSASFTDVAPGDWFYDGVTAAAGAGLVRGYPDGSFQPRADMTRAEVAQLLLNAA